MGNTTVWNQHFDLLEETIDQLHLWDNPKAIFNCDESDCYGYKMGTVVVSRKTKHAYSTRIFQIVKISNLTFLLHLPRQQTWQNFQKNEDFKML